MIEPVDVSVKFTASGAQPEDGDTLNAADGATGSVMRIRSGCVLVSVPSGLLTIICTVQVPADMYVCVMSTATVFVVNPSPKSQKRLVTPLIVEVSVKVTVSGAHPEEGEAVKFAAESGASRISP